MDINTLYSISSNAIKNSIPTNMGHTNPTSQPDVDAFGAIFQTALENINATNGYLSDAENEELKLAMGLTDNTHDLTIALEKAQTALQYTVAIRDKFLESYKELMQIQI